MKTKHKSVQDFIKEQPFLSIWLGVKTVAAMLQRYTRAEVIAGFEHVTPLEQKIKQLDVELKILKRQHESRLQVSGGK